MSLRMRGETNRDVCEVSIHPVCIPYLLAGYLSFIRPFCFGYLLHMSGPVWSQNSNRRSYDDDDDDDDNHLTFFYSDTTDTVVSDRVFFFAFLLRPMS